MTCLGFTDLGLGKNWGLECLDVGLVGLEWTVTASPQDYSLTVVRQPKDLQRDFYFNTSDD